MPETKDQLSQILAGLRQGDLISHGAVVVTGLGPSSVLSAAGSPIKVSPEELWSITAESEVGWYVVLSQDCDIVRSVADEPCLLVCPLRYVDKDRWLQLRHGPYSPREFPFPENVVGGPDSKRPVADVRLVTSIDKNAMQAPTMRTQAVLADPQRERFSSWLANRFDRSAFDDFVVDHVLKPAAAAIQNFIAQGGRKMATGEMPNASGRLCLSVDEWLIRSSGSIVDAYAVVSAESCIAQGLCDDDGNLLEGEIETGRSFVETKIQAKLGARLGYVFNLKVKTLPALPASIYRGLSPWILESHGDPLNQQVETTPLRNTN